MFNEGFFHAHTRFEVTTVNKKTKVTYFVESGPAFHIKEYNSLTSDTAVNGVIQRAESKPSLHTDRRYILDNVMEERVRIDNELKNKGYYFFNPDYLEFVVDSSQTGQQISMQLKIKEETPQKALKKYRVKHTYVIIDSTSRFDSTNISHDTLWVDQVHISVGKRFRPTAISNYVFLKEGQYYSREDHLLTISRLMGMGIFKYVNVKIEELDSTDLQVIINLAPLPKKSLSLELQAVTKSNNFVGPRVNASFSDRNLKGGAENLTFNFHGSVETQFTGQYKGLYTFEIGPRVQYSIPRFVLFKKAKLLRLYTPSTNFVLDYDFTRRVGYFDMNSLKLSFMYKWKTSIATDHEFTPAYINLFSLRNITQAFNEQLESDPSLKRRYEDQFIPGILYSYTYNEQTNPAKRVPIYINGIVDIAGNLANQVAKIQDNRNETGVRTLFGIAYAQYAKFSLDLRSYFPLDKRKKSQIVTRVFAGVGVPYGNSTALPYVKSFFSGGTNSVRAFPVNSLGPGTFRNDTTQNLYYAQQGGDIKMEGNFEVRFPVFSIIKGALFTDVGNTWLYRPNPEIPGGEFVLRQAISQLGMGLGFGIRLDLSFFVIRLDIATPIRKPWLPEDQRWVIDNLAFGSSAWRKENVVYNIAIGYPF
jgi:outer membrane protein assembly factor BamA